MTEIRTTFEKFGKSVLHLGFERENLATKVIVDCSKQIEEVEESYIVLKVRPPGEKNGYPAVTTIENGILTWIVSDADTAKDGYGEAQICLIGADGKQIKSAISILNIKRSIEDGGEVPDHVTSWIETADIVRQKAEEATKKALEAAKKAEDASGEGFEALTNEDLEELLK